MKQELTNADIIIQGSIQVALAYLIDELVKLELHGEARDSYKAIEVYAVIKKLVKDPSLCLLEESAQNIRKEYFIGEKANGN